MLSIVMNTVIQVGIVLLICLSIWAIRGRKASRFAPYVGLTAASFWLVTAAATGGAVVAAALLQLPAARELASGEGSVAASLTTTGPELIVGLVLLGAVKTAFAEELAQLVVRDGEGATKFVTVRVEVSHRPAS